MSRNFENFLEAYEQYSNDSFTPPQFNTWCGLSIIAGALERKVWLPWNDTFSYYPNIYVLLVALPGVGKSTALNKAVGLLQEMNQERNEVHLIPSQVTEAKFIELMGNKTVFQNGQKVHRQSAGYYFASEASNSLRNIYGDFIACLTDFYDCPTHWEKATLKDNKITLQNVCLNLIAGSTFEYLSKLVTAEQVMGGFASRLIYIVHNERDIRDQEFQAGASEEEKAARKQVRKMLVQDLKAIHKMVGPFTGSPEYGAAWKEWYSKFQREMREIQSEKLQSLMARVNTNVMKLSMLISAAESDDRILKLSHFEKTLDILKGPIADIPGIFREARSGNTETQDGLTQAIIKHVTKKELTVTALKKLLIVGGFPTYKIDSTINFMMTQGILAKSGITGTEVRLKLTVNADNYL